MIISRSLRLEDYQELAKEAAFVDEIQAQAGSPHPVHPQHAHRRWEYALAQRALKDTFGDRTNILVGDFGCGIGLWTPIALALGHQVKAYEIWAYGDEEWFVMQQIENVTRGMNLAPNFEMRHVAIGSLGDADRDFDAVYCISTLEHIQEERRAFDDLCKSVRPGGLLFLTMDFSNVESEVVMANNSFQRMYSERLLGRLAGYAKENGLGLLGGKSDWAYTVPLVHHYSFCSIAFTKEAK